MTKRRIFALASLFVAAIVAITIAITANHCPTVVSEGVCLALKNPAEDPRLSGGDASAPARSMSSEAETPIDQITIDQSLKTFDGFTGKTQQFLHIDSPSTSTSMIGIEITQEGYKKLLDGIGYESTPLPDMVYLTRHSAESIGYTSEDPAVRFVLIMEGE